MGLFNSSGDGNLFTSPSNTPTPHDANGGGFGAVGGDKNQTNAFGNTNTTTPVGTTPAATNTGLGSTAAGNSQQPTFAHAIQYHDPEAWNGLSREDHAKAFQMPVDHDAMPIDWQQKTVGADGKSMAAGNSNTGNTGSGVSGIGEQTQGTQLTYAPDSEQFTPRKDPFAPLQPSERDSKVVGHGSVQQQYPSKPQGGNVNLYYTDATGWNYNPPGKTMPYWGRGAGHVALGVNGKVYNYYENGPHIQDEQDYIHSVTDADGKRNSPGQDVYQYKVNATPEEAKQLEIELRKNPGSYDAIGKNRDCATYVQDSFQRATKAHPNPVQYNETSFVLNGFHHTPSQIIDNFKSAGRIDSLHAIYPAKDNSKYRTTLFWGVK